MANLADCVAIVFWRYAGLGTRQLDAVTTQVYTALEFYLLFLVGFGLLRRKTWSLAPLGIAAIVSGLCLPLLSAVILVSRQRGIRLAAGLCRWMDTGFRWRQCWIGCFYSSSCLT